MSASLALLLLNNIELLFLLFLPDFIPASHVSLFAFFPLLVRHVLLVRFRLRVEGLDVEHLFAFSPLLVRRVLLVLLAISYIPLLFFLIFYFCCAHVSSFCVFPAACPTCVLGAI
jgi:hypothetical protein